MIHKAVVFLRNNARVVFSDNLDDLKKIDAKCIVFDPDLEPLAGCPPHYWKLVDGKIEAMTAAEMKLRDAQIEAEGVNNDLTSAGPREKQESWIWLLFVIVFALLVLFFAM